MIKLSDTVLWADHTKAPLIKLSLDIHGIQIWPHIPTVHKILILLITLNPYIVLHKMNISSTLNLLSISLHTLNLYLRLQPGNQPLKLVMKLYTRTLLKTFPSVPSIYLTAMLPSFRQYHLHQHPNHTKIGHNSNH